MHLVYFSLLTCLEPAHPLTCPYSFLAPQKRKENKTAKQALLGCLVIEVIHASGWEFKEYFSVVLNEIALKGLPDPKLLGERGPRSDSFTHEDSRTHLPSQMMGREILEGGQPRNQVTTRHWQLRNCTYWLRCRSQCFISLSLSWFLNRTGSGLAVLMGLSSCDWALIDASSTDPHLVDFSHSLGSRTLVLSWEHSSDSPVGEVKGTEGGASFWPTLFQCLGRRPGNV